MTFKTAVEYCMQEWRRCIISEPNKWVVNWCGEYISFPTSDVLRHQICISLATKPIKPIYPFKPSSDNMLVALRLSISAVNKWSKIPPSVVIEPLI